MAQPYGMTDEMYRAVTALVDDRMKEIIVTRQDFDRLAEAQIRTGDRLDRVEATLDRLAQAQARTEERLNQLAEAQARAEDRLTRLEAMVEKLAQAQARAEDRLTRLEATVEKLAQAQARTEEQLQDLVQVVAGMQITLGTVKGRQLELTYQQRAGAYFGPLLRRLRVLSLIDMEDDLEAHLSPEEFEDLLRLDLLVSGRPRHLADAPPVWLATEISAVVDRRDVERARQRAAALRRAGYRAIPAVAGERATAGAEKEARLHKTLLL